MPARLIHERWRQLQTDYEKVHDTIIYLGSIIWTNC